MTVKAAGSSSLTSSSLLLFALFALPLVINPVVALSFDEVYLQPKVWWIVGVILPSALLVAWQGRNQFRWNLVTALLLGIGVWLLASTLIFHPTPSTWLGAADRLDGVLMHGVYLFVALAGVTWAAGRDPAQIKPHLGNAALIGGALLALTGVLQQLHLLGVPGDGASGGVGATPFGGFLGNRGYLGGALAMLLPVLLWTAQQSRAKWTGFAVILVTWGWLGTFTRGAWLAGGLGLLVLIMVMRFDRRTWMALLTGAACFALSTVAFDNARQFGSENQAIGDSSGRGVLWKSAWVGIQEQPLLGWGPPALWRVMATRSTEVLIAESNLLDVQSVRRIGSDPMQAPVFVVTYTGKNKAEMFAIGVNKVHNEYLDYALTYGIPAALLFTVLLFSAIWSGRKVVPGISAGLVAYAAYLFTWPEIIRFAPIAWFLMGVALAAGSTRQPPADLAKNDLQPAPKS